MEEIILPVRHQANKQNRKPYNQNKQKKNLKEGVRENKNLHMSALVNSPS